MIGLLAALALAPSATAAHFTGMTATPVVFVRQPADPDAATIRLDEAAIARALVDDATLIEMIVSYDIPRVGAWKAEAAIDPNLEAIFAATGADAHLIATSFGTYERDYWFATPAMAPTVTALRALPQPEGAAIAVLLSNPESLAALKPSPDELRHGGRR